jgi:hypothetical protein
MARACASRRKSSARAISFCCVCILVAATCNKCYLASDLHFGLGLDVYAPSLCTDIVVAGTPVGSDVNRQSVVDKVQAVQLQVQCLQSLPPPLTHHETWGLLKRSLRFKLEHLSRTVPWRLCSILLQQHAAELNMAPLSILGQPDAAADGLNPEAVALQLRSCAPQASGSNAPLQISAQRPTCPFVPALRLQSEAHILIRAHLPRQCLSHLHGTTIARAMPTLASSRLAWSTPPRSRHPTCTLQRTCFGMPCAQKAAKPSLPSSLPPGPKLCAASPPTPAVNC